MSSLPALNKIINITSGAASPLTETQTNRNGSFVDFLKTQGAAALQTLKHGEEESLKGIVGQADVDSLVTALTDSRLTLKTMVKIRDEILHLLQEIRQMQI